MKKPYLSLMVVFILFSCSDDNDNVIENNSVISEFRMNLSELNIFIGDLNNLVPNPIAFEYELSTKLFTDYATKERLLVLPEGTRLTYNGDGLPIFPDNTLIAKTFYYHLDERDFSLGKHIIETRILIKKNGLWETGNYIWNDDQTEATLNYDTLTTPVTWINSEGNSQSINYRVPSDVQCFVCHSTNDIKRPIGLKMRSLNFEINGMNQIQTLIDRQYLSGLNSPSEVGHLPVWNDLNNFSLEERARAYLDVNCAHCHTDGGYCQEISVLRLDFETPFDDTKLFERKSSMIYRVGSDFQEGLTMPWIGTTILHDEGVDLILNYLNSLD